MSKKPLKKMFDFSKKSLIRISLANYVTTIITFSGIIAVVIICAFAIYQLNAFHSNYAMPLTFIETESVAKRLEKDFIKVAHCLGESGKKDSYNLKCLRPPHGIIQKTSAQQLTSLVQNSSFKTVTAGDLGISSFDLYDKYNLVLHRERLYVLVEVKESDVQKYMPLFKHVNSDPLYFAYRFIPDVLFSKYFDEWSYATTAYLVSKTGQLLYHRSFFAFDEANYNQRDLVQYFIKNSFDSSVVEVSGSIGHKVYGSFHNVAGSNAVVFQETSSLGVMWRKSYHQIFMMIAFSLAAYLIMIIYVRFFMKKIVTSLNYLTSRIQSFVNNQFDAATVPKSSIFKEIQSLSENFTKLAHTVLRRDQTVKGLIAEQERRRKLSSQLEIARVLQENFLPQAMLDARSGLSLFCNYHASDYVSGDWFSFHYNEKTEESVIIIADVTGHDVASSMLTAMISSSFYDTISSEVSPFPILEFKKKIHNTLRRFGSGKWGVTMQIVTYTKGNSYCEVLNCGHVFPIILSAKTEHVTVSRTFRKDKEVEKVVANAKSVAIPSDPLGYIDDPQGKVKRVDFKLGDTLILYTDGITESKNMEGKLFGNKRLIQILKKMYGRSMHEIVTEVLMQSRNFRGQMPQEDDICVIAFRNESAQESQTRNPSDSAVAS